MSNPTGIDAILTAGNRKEKGYDWSDAIEIYYVGLDSVPAHDFSVLGELYERLGYAFCRAAMQADDVDEFRNRLNKAIMNYDKGLQAYDKMCGFDTIAHGKRLRCEAAKAYIWHWLAIDSSERKDC